MKHPPYHLRVNKGVDRFMLIEALKRLSKIECLDEYTYYGMGGPFLEDFRLIYEFYPEIKMVSIEDNADTYLRQKFHKPCRHIKLRYAELSSFLANYNSNDKKSIFWLDYIALELSNFEDFKVLLDKVATNSIIKITLRSEPKDYFETDDSSQKADEFRNTFIGLLPNPHNAPPGNLADFASLLQEMLQVASEQVLPSSNPRTLQPISSFFYADGVGMFTFTGIVCDRANRTIRHKFSSLPFSNLNWDRPKQIDVPIISTKERLLLQSSLPCPTSPGEKLLRALGYLIDDTVELTETKLTQYSDFHRQFPYFIRGIP